MADRISSVFLPKHGFTMHEGTFNGWLKEEGDSVRIGEPIAEIETEKTSADVEAPASGILRRLVARPGEVMPVGSLLGVIADQDVSDDEIDAFVADYPAPGGR